MISVIQNNNTLALAAAHAGLSTTTLTEDQTDSGITTIYTSLHPTNGTKKRKLSEDNVRVKQETGIKFTFYLAFLFYLFNFFYKQRLVAYFTLNLPIHMGHRGL